MPIKLTGISQQNEKARQDGEPAILPGFPYVFFGLNNWFSEKAIRRENYFLSFLGCFFSSFFGDFAFATE